MSSILLRKEEPVSTEGTALGQSRRPGDRCPSTGKAEIQPLQRERQHGPPTVLAGGVGRTWRWILDLATDPAQSWWVCGLVLIGDAVVTAGVIWKIPYTEIDWRAYMQQVQTYMSGERNYAKIRGGTGPLVYPAAHVYVFRTLYALTSAGTDIFAAQVIFGALYLVTLALVMACYRRAAVPPWVYPLLALSKRLHSVYVLRLFNDPWAVLFFWACAYLAQRQKFSPAIVAYSLGLGVKMSLLLVLPGLGFVLYLAQGPWVAVGSLAAMVQYQVFLGLPFLAKFPREYLSKAFEFNRVFMFKWTVNWRFVGEDMFLSRGFALGLLVVHLSLLTALACTRWLPQARLRVTDVLRSFASPARKTVQERMTGKVTPRLVLDVLLAANTIGMLCARTLHYQFYSWIAWATPYLLWRSGVHPVGAVLIWAAQEVAWNVYPSTNWSSGLVVACLSIQVAGLWSGTRDTRIPDTGSASRDHSHDD